MPEFRTILKQLWRLSEGDLVFLPIRNGDTWHEPDGLTPSIAVEVVNWMLNHPQPQQVDYYFTPLKYNGRRQRDKVGRPGVIFADMDAGVVPTTLPPSLLIESSPSHMHGYWFLENPVTLEEWEPKAREWSRQLGADPGGWDATQVLRLPGTPNMKYEDTKVLLLEYKPERIYLINDFPDPRETPRNSTRSGMPDLSQDRLALVAEVWEELPLSSRYYLTMDEVEYRSAGITDRSEMLWGVIQTLLERGFLIHTIFKMMHGAPWDKYASRPEVLWTTIQKASFLYNNRSPIAL